MKLIKPSFQIIEPTGYTIDDIYKSIELAGRVSHKSEDKIIETSAKDFVGRMLNMKHLATCEFGTVYLYAHSMYDLDIEKYRQNPYSKAIWNNNGHYISTNYRALVENNWLDDLKYLREPTKYHHKRYTVHMILDRGVMDEFRTHVGLSHLAESTRYCNYSKDKFGNELTFIQPCWDIRGTNYIDFLQHAEWGYFRMLKNGWTPQQARSILPLGIKSELISCGFEDAWENFFKRRDAPDAHPMAQEIANPMHKEFFKLTRAL